MNAAKLIGGRAVVVSAIDDESAAFWVRRGFIQSKDDPLRLFRAIAKVSVSLVDARP